MPQREYIQLLQATQRMTELRDMESLVTFILAQAEVLTGAKAEYIILFKSENLMPESACFGPAGQTLELPVHLSLSLAHEKAISPSGRAWFTLNDSVLQELGIQDCSVLYLPFRSRGGLQGGIMLRALYPAVELRQPELLLCFLDHASACFENALLNRRMEDQINYLLSYDDLVTKLPNHKVFRHALVEAVSLNPGQNLLAMLFVDIDNLTHVNRTLGHHIGDLLLFLAAQRMKDFVTSRGLGSIPARVGGDEFALILKDIKTPRDARATALEMLADLRKPMDLNGTNYLITASIGIGLYPWDAETAEALVHCTASAMYAAKEQGKDRCSFYNTHSENTCFMRALG